METLQRILEFAQNYPIGTILLILLLVLLIIKLFHNDNNGDDSQEWSTKSKKPFNMFHSSNHTFSL